ncbi:MAG: DUF5069 domain-containing protein [Vulcanimicrobiaceae bacterium]
MARPDADLRRHPPRSPREQLAGLYFLARTIDKARAHLAGTLGPYKISPGISAYLFEWLGFSEADFIEVVREAPDDEAVVAWVRAHSDPGGYGEINMRLETRGIRDAAHREAVLPAYPLLRDHPDLTNWFAILELDDRLLYAPGGPYGAPART